jgi:hypothetical protein
MQQFVALGIDGLISDRPDLFASLGVPSSFDPQGHRGARGLRPENTLPAFSESAGCSKQRRLLDNRRYAYDARFVSVDCGLTGRTDKRQ